MERGRVRAGTLLYHSGMSTVGVFIFLLIAFFALHRWYIRPQDDAGRRSRTAGPAAAREHPGDADREPGPPSDGHGHGDGAPGAGTGSGPGSGGDSGGGDGSGGGGGGSGDGD